MSYTPEYFWKNFRLGTELQISGSFIYNALYFFDQMEHFCNDEEIFEFLYNASVGLERLEKIAIILLEHDSSMDQEEFEKTLITHSHSELLDRIKKKKEINLGKRHNKFIQLLSKFYKSMRYDRYNLSSVYKPNQDAFAFINLIQDELKIEIKTDMLFATANDDNIKKFIGKLVGKIVIQIYQIVKDESRSLNLYTYETSFSSKAYKIFMCEEFTFQKENLFKKEILIYLINNKERSGFIEFIKGIEPIPLDMGDVHEYVKYLLKPHNHIQMLDELESIYEDDFDKERMEIVELIGNDNVSFENEEDEDFCS
jgi:hypothetical protein